MPKENRSRHYSGGHYSYNREYDRDRDRDRSPRDRGDRGRSPYAREYRGDRGGGGGGDRDRRDYYNRRSPNRNYPSPYGTYPPSSSYMSEHRRGGFVRGRGGDQQRRQQQPQYNEPPPQLPQFGPKDNESKTTGTWAARGGPQSGYSRQPPQQSQQSGQSARAFQRVGGREEEGDGGSAEGKKEKSAGRGSWRGGRILPAELLVTRAKELTNKKGTGGDAIVLKANYFRLITKRDWCLNQYSVKFEPNEEKTSTRKGLVRATQDKLGAYIFDGSILYSVNKYPEPTEFVVKRAIDDTDIRISIQFTKEIGKSDYQYLQFFSIIMRKCYEQLQLQLVGRNYFDERAKVVVKEYGLELWPGYVTSIRQHEHDILMSSEITHKVMRQETLLTILNETYRIFENKFKDKYIERVVGLVVLTDYNNNTYRIEDVDFDVTPMSKFTKKDKTEITYKEYYQQRYGINIQQNNQPMLVTQSKPKDRRGGKGELVYLVPELCRATGITDEMRNNHRLMNALAVHTRVSPAQRIQKLLAFNQRLYSVPNIIEEFQRWNMELEKHLIDVPGRVLPEESIFIGSGKSAKPENAEWTKGLRSCNMYAQTNLAEWFIIHPRGKGYDINKFISDLVKVGNGFRMKIDPPKICELRDDKSSDYANEIENIMSRYNPQIICCVTSNNRSDRYSAIKKKCAVDRPVPSQVVLIKNALKGMSVATKICIQMNCKVGGAPWTVNIPLTGLMVVGFDVCHDANAKNRDYGAMVASLDKYCTRYFSTVCAHSGGEELSNYFAVNLVKALRKFEEANQALPSRIVIYRDGVGEGDIAYVVEHEIGAIKKALNEAYGDPELVKFAFILVTKRINTRLFYNQANPPPGTIVDDVITNPVKFDFFLVSQYTKQGTVSPTAYSVLYSSCGLDPDKIQRLTYKLTHMYFNWCGTVRVPAPCQYAHKLAFLVAQAIHRAPDSALDSILHFL